MMLASNDREPSFPDHEPTAGRFLEHLVATHGDAPLIITAAGRLSYRQADTGSRVVARGLLARGVGKGTRIGLLAPNGPEWVVGWLAIARVGAVAVPLNTYLKPRELARTLRHADIALLLTVDDVLGTAVLSRLEESVDGLADRSHGSLRTMSHPNLREVWVWGEDRREWCAPIDDLIAAGEAIDDAIVTAVERDVSPADPMVIVYSSGSTSEPKGAIHSHGSVIRHAHNLWQFRDLHAGDIIYTPMPLFWIGGLSYTLVAAMHAGAALVYEERFEASGTLDLIERERCTHVIGWPHMMKALADDPSLSRRDLSAIRSPGLRPPEPGAEPPDPMLRPNALGMTETLGPHTLEREGSVLPTDKAGSFGRSVPGVEHKVVDPLTGDDAPPGEMGEILIRGYSMMQGLNKVEREDAFTVDGWYRTGDGGWFDGDGHLFFRGRLGDAIKSSGINIIPREVELVLEEHEAVMHAFVMGIEHPDHGEDVAAAVVARPGRSPEPAELAAWVKGELASYKVPRHVLVVADQGELPWLESGKIDRRAVGRLLAQRFADL